MFSKFFSSGSNIRKLVGCPAIGVWCYVCTTRQGKTIFTYSDDEYKYNKDKDNDNDKDKKTPNY